jgi:hypothetical protein
MKRVNFDIKASTKTGTDIRTAARVMQKNRRLLSAPDIFAVWVGARASEPYIMLGIKPGRGSRLSKVIPDSIEGVNVYFMEGTGVLH